MMAAATTLLLSVLAQGAVGPRMGAQRTANPPIIDGRLDDIAWNLAVPSDAFTQLVPDERQAPTEKTTVRVLYDDHNVYIGVVCEHRHLPILQRLTRRDRELDDADRVAITISSRRDRSSAFRFAVNVAGVLSDGLYFDDTSYDQSWDENWDSATAVTADGWTAEFRIPLGILRFEELAQQSWGFNVERWVAARQELDVWTYIPRIEGGFVSRLGALDGIDALPASTSTLELRPFVVASLGRQNATFGLFRNGSSSPASFSRSSYGPNGDARSIGGAVGLDGRWHVTRDLTLDGTLNPDFGQVEADELVLNLTSIETFYPEKRPFFLEGLDIFATPFSVLYTRRIGAVPALSLPAGETLLRTPAPSAIAGALKLAGRVGQVSIGALSAMTEANEVAALDGAGQETVRLADPTTLFNVLRVRVPIEGGHVGFIGSATNRLAYDGPTSVGPTGAVICPGATTERVLGDCFHDAYVGGVDGRWHSPGADYMLQLQTIGSLISGGQPVHLRDGTTIGAGDTSLGTNVTAAKTGGKHWQWYFNGGHFGRDLQLNDAGYLGRQNEIGGILDLHYVTKEPVGPVLETDTKLGLRHWRNLDGLVLTNYVVLNAWAHFRNQWSASTLIQTRGSYFDDREVGDGTALKRAALRGWEVDVDGDPRRAITPHLLGRLWRLTDGWYTDLLGSVVMRAHPQLDLELVPTLSYTSGEPRFIEEQAGGHLLFGRLSASSIATTFRATYTFAPRLSLQGYAQLFLARGHYSDFFGYTRSPGTRPAISLHDLAPTDAVPSSDPDFQRAALNTSLVLRWEFRLGSTLYIVYSRSQLPQTTLQTGERPALDLTLLPRAPAADVLLVKLTYWWS